MTFIQKTITTLLFVIFVLLLLLCGAVLHEGISCRDDIDNCNRKEEAAQFERLQMQETAAKLAEELTELKVEYERMRVNYLKSCEREDEFKKKYNIK